MVAHVVLGILFFIAWIVVFHRYFVTHPIKKIWYPVLLLKMISAFAAYFLYFNFYEDGDMVQYLSQAEVYRESGVIPNPFSRSVPTELVEKANVMTDRNAIFFAKFIALLFIILAHPWMVVSFFAIFSTTMIFYGLGLFIHPRHTPSESKSLYAFLILPSLLFWGSGIFKEALAFPLLLIIIGGIKDIVNHKNLSWQNILAIGLGVFMLWYVKYFLVALVVVSMTGFLIHHYLYERGISYRRSFAFALVTLTLPVWLMGYLHYNLDVDHLWGAIYDTHQMLLNNSNTAITVTYSLTSRWYSAIDDLPLALVSGLFFPLPWQVWNTLSFVVSLENTFILIMTATFTYQLIRKWERVGKNPFQLWLFIFVLGGALLISITTPNMGTLSRYKMAYMPFLIYLMINILQSIRKPSDSIR